MPGAVDLASPFLAADRSAVAVQPQVGAHTGAWFRRGLTDRWGRR